MTDKSRDDAVTQAGPAVITRREQIAAVRTSGRKQGMARRRLGWMAEAVIISLTAPWVLMTCTGIAHHDWWHLVPPMGYHTALFLTCLPLAVVFGIMALAARK